VALAPSLGDAPRHFQHLGSVSHGRTAEFLDNDRHKTPQKIFFTTELHGVTQSKTKSSWIKKIIFSPYSA
jgi:hypothetical protein